jgi:hypothetical protein
MKTKGEQRVRVDFNVSNDNYVSQLKVKGAEFIDLINQAANKPDWSNETLGEWKRLQSLAMTAIEEGTMWGVKAATI